MDTDILERAKQNAGSITQFKKLTHLSNLSEDDFRDKVVRPLYFRMGLTDGRELCGPDEEGKDTIFIEQGKLKRIVHAIQTKKGVLNMSREPKQSVAEAISQLRTALQVKYPFIGERKKVRPDYVILCVSGKANTAARKHISEELDDERLMIQDANDLIPLIDQWFPEYWYGIDADKFPYYVNLKQELTLLNDTVLFENAGSMESPVSERYIQVYVYRMQRELKKYKGRHYSQPKYERIPVVGVLRQRSDKLIAIVGEGGAGKSTALRRLAYQTVEEATSTDKPSQFPVLLRAKEIANDTARLVDIAASETKRVAKAKNACFNTDDLTSGKLVVLVDALDEVTVEGGRQMVIQKILAFNSDYPNCRVVLTSRTEVFNTEGGPTNRFAVYEVSSLSKDQVEQLVNKLVHLKSLPSELARETLRKINDVHGVTLSPLLVTIFVATSDYNRQDAPANITEVFKKYTEMMLGRWDQTKGFAQQHKYKIKDHLLQKLAVHMHRARKTALSVKDCKRLIEDELESLGQEKEFDSLFKEVCERSCLLRIDGDFLEFRHLLFQEFFAGRGLRDKDEVKVVLHEKWWTRAVVFYFGEHPMGQTDINSIVGQLDTTPSAAMYTSAVALGLATQACYLSKKSERLTGLKWVVQSLSRSKQKALEDGFKSAANPVMGMIMYYVFARDAVGSALIVDLLPEINAQAENEVAKFWCISALIDCGLLEDAYEEIRQYKPQDNHLLFALLLACVFIENVKVTSSKNLALAMKIKEFIQPRVLAVANEFSQELKSLVYEVRKDKMEAIEVSASEKDTEQQ
jgi:molybdopterin-guanine dinucleotide biosynthesis protein